MVSKTGIGITTRRKSSSNFASCSWTSGGCRRYYVGNDTCKQPPCPSAGRKYYGTSYNRNPLPGFSSFADRQADGEQLERQRPADERLPVGRGGQRNRPGRRVGRTGFQRLGPPRRAEHDPHGMAYVTRLVNAAMRSPEWDSTAIFLTWDDWGGFYDHVMPKRSTRWATACASPAS